MTDELISVAFESVGIPKMQTVVYLDLLKHKASTATQISKRTKMHRANVYDTLTKLKEKNLVYLSNKEGKQVFAALSTDSIVNDEREKLENLKVAIEYIKKDYVQDVPLKVYSLEGLNVIRGILFSLLDKKSDIWIYGLAEDENILNLLNDKLMHAFHIERIRRNINLKLLFYRGPVGEIKKISKIKGTESRLLPNHHRSKDSKITQIVCNDCVYTTLWISPIHTIVIENKIISKEYTDLYEVLWDSSKKIE